MPKNVVKGLRLSQVLGMLEWRRELAEGGDGVLLSVVKGV
jgi:hypothetical protein